MAKKSSKPQSPKERGPSKSTREQKAQEKTPKRQKKTSRGK